MGYGWSVAQQLRLEQLLASADRLCQEQWQGRFWWACSTLRIDAAVSGGVRHVVSLQFASLQVTAAAKINVPEISDGKCAEPATASTVTDIDPLKAACQMRGTKIVESRYSQLIIVHPT